MNFPSQMIPWPRVPVSASDWSRSSNLSNVLGLCVIVCVAGWVRKGWNSYFRDQVNASNVFWEIDPKCNPRTLKISYPKFRYQMNLQVYECEVQGLMPPTAAWLKIDWLLGLCVHTKNHTLFVGSRKCPFFWWFNLRNPGSKLNSFEGLLVNSSHYLQGKNHTCQVGFGLGISFRQHQLCFGEEIFTAQLKNLEIQFFWKRSNKNWRFIHSIQWKIS